MACFSIPGTWIQARTRNSDEVIEGRGAVGFGELNQVRVWDSV